MNPQNKIKVGIIGGSGYAGEELVRLVSLHANAELYAVSSRDLCGRTLKSVYDQIHDLSEISFINPDDSIFLECEVIFLATPHGFSMSVTETFLDNGNEGVVQKRSLDVQPILENNKRLYNQNDGYSPDKGLKRIATIPTIILEIWTKEYHKDQNKGNWFDLPKDIQQKILREKLNSSDYRYFRTSSGKF